MVYAEVSKLSKKGQRVNILGLAVHTVSVATIHLCYSSAKVAMDNT